VHLISTACAFVGDADAYTFIAAMIPQAFIQDLLARVDIVDVVGRYVQLKKGGQNLLGLCPFHGEKSPSFTEPVEAVLSLPAVASRKRNRFPDGTSRPERRRSDP
jgi:hypothetical protein